LSILEVNSVQSNLLNLNTQLTVGNVTLNTTTISTGSINITGNTTLSSVTVNGTSYSTLSSSLEYTNTQIFTSSELWNKPTWATNGNELVVVHAWGGGGGGNTGTGGGGGAFVSGYYLANNLGNTVSVVVGSGGGTVSTTQSVRYVRWVITAVRTPGSGTQASEFVLQNAGVDISMTGTTVTSSEAGSPGNQLPAQLVDGNLATKFYTGNGPTITLTFDLGSVKTFTGYRWATAEDVNERDPVSWTVQISSDNVNWTVVDTRTNFATSTSRNVYIGPFTFTALNSGSSSAFGNLIAYGGGEANTTIGGGGGGWLSAGLIANGGGPLGNTTVSGTSTFGGGAGGNTSTSTTGGISVYGGGGGGCGSGAGGYTVFGGGGGTATGARGTSVYGGLGGNSSVAASAPGGGGANNASGARGEVRVYTYRVAP
jgi:hypothetical protein